MPDLLMPWLWEHYTADFASLTLRCKRCGQAIYYATRHARDAHGDDVEVLPARSKPTPGRHYDDVPVPV